MSQFFLILHIGLSSQDFQATRRQFVHCGQDIAHLRRACSLRYFDKKGMCLGTFSRRQSVDSCFIGISYEAKKLPEWEIPPILKVLGLKVLGLKLLGLTRSF